MVFLIFLFLFVAGVLKSGLFIVKRISKVKWFLLRRSSQGEFFENKPWKGKEPPVFSGYFFWEACGLFRMVLCDGGSSRRGAAKRSSSVCGFVSSCRLSEMVYDNLLSLRAPSAERLKKVASGFFSQVRVSLSLHQTSKNTAGLGTGGLHYRLQKSLYFISRSGRPNASEGLKACVRRIVKQAHAKTLQAAMRAARAAECEPEAAGDENYLAPPSVYSASTVLRQGNQGNQGGNTFSCGSTDSGRGRQNRRDTRCYHCGRHGHIARFCWGHRSGSHVQAERNLGVH